MAKINLLPWREELRQKKKKDFLTSLTLSAVAAAGVFALVYTIVEGKISYQEQRNQILVKENTVLDEKISAISNIEEKKKKLLAKIDLLQKLQESRPEIVHVFDEIPRIVPDGVYLKKFTQKGGDLIFEGKSQSNARVSSFMRAIEVSQWLHTPSLDVIKFPEKNNPDQTSDFILRAKQGNKNNLPKEAEKDNSKDKAKGKAKK
jgi:type IV pilus assembly protein PilN